jgi:hypothetical protein
MSAVPNYVRFGYRDHQEWHVELWIEHGVFYAAITPWTEYGTKKPGTFGWLCVCSSGETEAIAIATALRFLSDLMLAFEPVALTVPA